MIMDRYWRKFKRSQDDHKQDLLDMDQHSRNDLSVRRAKFYRWVELSSPLGAVAYLIFGIYSRYKLHFILTPIACVFIGVSLLFAPTIFRHKSIGGLRKQVLPRFGALEVLFFFLPLRNREHIIGDLEEEYCIGNKRFPRFWYLGQVLALVGCYWWASLNRIVGRDTIRKIIRK